MVVAVVVGEVRLFVMMIVIVWDCNADTDNSDDDNGDHECIIIRPQTKFRGYIGVCRSVCLSV
ncbi:hypothetical protein DPMN_054841 [Dreissena polymorpha]|uniref:Uncharacterized protein n=1 Tax=Dreissena polymorpha TaxID=45954 RepID=A0A9D4HTG8_DREPO|nr:hypothetical protein DPMN_052064 [Dreissena polymorpha]KAH3728878.1 hypothetical protein DPMN_054841 [Dreissena polymorpha]